MQGISGACEETACRCEGNILIKRNSSRRRVVPNNYSNSSAAFFCEKMTVSADGNRIACILVNDIGEKSNDIFEFRDGMIIREIEFLLG